MADLETFNDIIEARTRTADFILRTADLLAKFIELGGLKSDLEEIVSHGNDAELLDQAQGSAQGKGGAGTIAVLQSFANLQTEYKKVMAVVIAVRRDLQKAGAAPEVLTEIVRILKDETAVVLRTVEPTAGSDTAAAGGKPKRQARPSKTQEAVRAEIHRDATALIALTAAHKALGARKVDLKRLKKLQLDAKALSGKLADRAAAKGAGKSATVALHDAVGAQKDIWSASYRILATLGRTDERVRALLAQAARKR